MTTTPDEPTTAIDPDGDPENLASKNPQDPPGASGAHDGVREASSVQDDPEDRDDADADPENMSSSL